jgi:hypothetical protein
VMPAEPALWRVRLRAACTASGNQVWWAKRSQASPGPPIQSDFRSCVELFRGCRLGPGCGSGPGRGRGHGCGSRDIVGGTALAAPRVGVQPPALALGLGTPLPAG